MRLVSVATLCLVVAIALTSRVVSAERPTRVLLKELQAITAVPGKMTLGRRTPPVPQAQCQSGCGVKFGAIRCKNDGWDGRDVQWSCKASGVEQGYKIKVTGVSCEGFDDPNDEYILAGSCSVSYKAKAKRGSAPPPQQQPQYQQGAPSTAAPRQDYFADNAGTGSEYSFGNIVFKCLTVALLLFLLYSCCSAAPNEDEPPAYPGGGLPGAGAGNDRGGVEGRRAPTPPSVGGAPGGPSPPPYHGSSPARGARAAPAAAAGAASANRRAPSGSSTSQQQQQQQDDSSASGSVISHLAAAGAGALAGYMVGSRGSGSSSLASNYNPYAEDQARRQQQQQQQQYAAPVYSRPVSQGWGGGGAAGAASADADSDSDDEGVSFVGGTQRR